MVILQKLYKKPIIFQRLTGLTPNKFQQLLIRLEPLFKEAELKRKKIDNRKRKPGGGRKQKCSPPSRTPRSPEKVSQTFSTPTARPPSFQTLAGQPT